MNLGKDLLDQKQRVFGPEALAKQLSASRPEPRGYAIGDRFAISPAGCERSQRQFCCIHPTYAARSCILYTLLLSVVHLCSRANLIEKVLRKARLPQIKRQKAAVVGDAKRRRGVKRRQERNRRRDRLV